MSHAIEIKPAVYWIGSQDPELKTFDDLFPTENGTTYNSYLIKGSEKMALIDTVKAERAGEFITKIRSLIDPATIDYVIINHTEPDHSGSLIHLLALNPDITVVATRAAHTFLSNLIHIPFKSHVVRDGEILDLGDRQLRFIIAPFLHWPDTMFTKLEPENILFTCDAFGAHYVGESIFNDQLPDYTKDMQIYFDCIMRPFKDKALAALKKIRTEEISMIAPSHGPVLRSDPWKYVRRYEEWSAPAPPTGKVLLLYLSPHGNTGKMAAEVAKGVSSVLGIHLEAHHINHLNGDELKNKLEEADALIFGIPTVNRDIPPTMWNILIALTGLKLNTRIAGVFGSFGWSGEACAYAEERLKHLGFTLAHPVVRAQFTPRPEALADCFQLGLSVAEAVNSGLPQEARTTLLQNSEALSGSELFALAA
ncbi:MAG: FprA family A-type flavoprotein [Desulfuromonadaceae bacterium]